MVSDSKYQGLREEQTPLVFAPAMQQERPWFPAFLVRGPRPSSLVGMVTQSIAAVDPDIDIQFKVLKTEISNSLVRERLLAMLSSGFGLLAALLSTLGVYGVMSVNRGPPHRRDRHSSGAWRHPRHHRSDGRA